MTLTFQVRATGGAVLATQDGLGVTMANRSGSSTSGVLATVAVGWVFFTKAYTVA